VSPNATRTGRRNHADGVTRPAERRITFPIAIEFLSPPPAVCFRLCAVFGAAVPEASIDVHRDLGPGEHQVGASSPRDRPAVNPVPKAERMHSAPHGELGLCIPATLALHPAENHL